MILHNLLIELLNLLDLGHKRLNSRLVLQVLQSLVLFKVRFLITELHEDSFMLGSLLLNLII